MKGQLINKLFSYFFAFLATLFAIRISRFFYLKSLYKVEEIVSISGFIIDLLFALIVFLVLGGIYFICYKLFKKQLDFIIYFFSILLIVVELILIEYYKSMSIFLDEGLYNYSFNEILTISGGASSVSPFMLIGVSIFILGFIVLSSLLKKLVHFSKRSILLLFTLLLIPLFIFTLTNKLKLIGNNFKGNNSTFYFLVRTTNYLNNYVDYNQVGFNDYKIENFSKLEPHFFAAKGMEEEYPFFHNLPENSEFAKLLNLTSDGKAPNIVFIFSESLSTYFVGDYADSTGHLMPFLDSLTKESLYWPNFLSVCDRTYHALPGAMASIPVVPGGRIFMEMKNPHYFSLINLLEDNYFSRFFTGHFMTFTQMDSYLNANNISYIVKDWEPQFSDIINGEKSFWGYHEEELFGKSWLDYKNQSLAGAKRLDFFLTISTHPPFILKEKDKYLSIAKERMLRSGKANGIDYSEKIDKYLDEFSTYAYYDDQLKTYFEKAKEMPDFENTIFIIFGDHGTHITNYDELSAYRIPLIIYSPLLKKPQKFKGVSSQLDLAPTIISYLRENYIPNLPSKAPFAGKELSYSEEYENNKMLLMGTFVRNEDYLLNKEYFIHSGQLFEVGENLFTKPIENKEVYNRMLEQKELAKEVVNYAVYNDRFAPKDYVTEYIKTYKREKIYSSIYEKVITQDENENKKNIDVGQSFEVPQDIDQLEINFDIYYRGENDEYSPIPKLTIDITDEEGQYVHWTDLYYFEENDLKKNEWNYIWANKTIDIAEIIQKKKEYLKGNLIIHYYLHNTDDIKVELKSARATFYKKQAKREGL